MPELLISAAERGGFRQVLVSGHLLTVSRMYVIEEDDGDRLAADAEIIGVAKCGDGEFMSSLPLDVSEGFYAKAQRAVQDFTALQ